MHETIFAGSQADLQWHFKTAICGKNVVIYKFMIWLRYEGIYDMKEMSGNNIQIYKLLSYALRSIQLFNRYSNRDPLTVQLLPSPGQPLALQTPPHIHPAPPP